MAGRPTDCTPELAARIVEQIRSGATLEDAALLGGIARSTLSLWLAKGKAGEARYSEFADAATRAKAEFKQSLIGKVLDSRFMNGEPDHRGPLEILKARHPDEYGEQRTVNIKVSKELEAALARLEGIKDKLGADLYDLVLGALAGDAGAGEAGQGEG